jgi:hypothetical protein
MESGFHTILRSAIFQNVIRLTVMVPIQVCNSQPCPEYRPLDAFI